MTLKVKSAMLVLVLALLACKGTVVKIEPETAAGAVDAAVRQTHPMHPDPSNLTITEFVPLPPDGE
jgi:hypothetical protein